MKHIQRPTKYLYLHSEWLRQCAEWCDALVTPFEWNDEADEPVVDESPAQWKGLSTKGQFERIVQLYQTGFFAIAGEDEEKATEYRELVQGCFFGLHRMMTKSETLPDIETIECWYLALKETNPMEGYPIYQMQYDDFFKVVVRGYSDFLLDKAWLDEIREDYRERVKHHLDVRGHEEFRNQSYYWFSLWNDGILNEPDFMSLYKDDARQVGERSLSLLRKGNGNGLYMDADFWADYALTAFVGLLFYDDDNQRQLAVELARNLLPDISDKRIKAHVLVHLYYITREEALKKEAEAIMVSWGNELDMHEEDARLIDFKKTI